MTPRDDLKDSASPKAGLSRRELLRALAAVPALLSGLARRTLAGDSPEEAAEVERPGTRRVVVLGLDGLDPRLVRKWMAEGHLPNLKRLAEEGSFQELATVNPAETPVAWASFATGANPARTRVFDLLRRHPAGYHVVPGDIWLERKRATEEGADIIARVMRRVGLGAGVVAAAVLLVGRWLVRHLLGRRASFVFGSAVAGLLVGVVGGSALVGLVAGLVAGSVVADWAPRTCMKYSNPLGAPTFWELADRAGWRCRVLGVPSAFPAVPLEHGRVLSGYPAPDMTAGGFAIYTSAERPPRGDSKMRVFRISTREPVIETVVVGPFDRVAAEDESRLSPQPTRRTQVPVTIIPHRETRRVTIRVQGQEQTIGERQWSDWFTFTFQMSPLVREVGIARFCLVTFTDEELRLYLMPLNYDPRRLPPNVRLAHPPEFLSELVRDLGLFKTAGWAIDTFRPLIAEQIDDELFLIDLYFTMNKKWEIIFHELAKKDWDILVGVLMGPDRVQHMMWRHIDPQHPAHDPEEAKLYRDSILGVYQTVDKFVGVARKLLPAHTRLFVISDHGFGPFHKGVNLNRWLQQEGYLVLKTDKPQGETGREYEFWEVTDWRRTRAYAPGLSGIYINVIGREPLGAVEPGAQYQQLREEIRRKLQNLTDPETGRRVVHRVYRREELYQGPYLEELPDLIIGYERGYRTERASLKVSTERPVISTNRTKWCGDHITVDPELVPGVLFSNCKITGGKPRLIDLAPTILRLMGVRPPAGMDGKALKVGLPQGA